MTLALAGCGDGGRDFTRLARLNPHVRIVGAADFDRGRARRCAGRRGNAFSDYREMLERLRPDAVYLALPHHLHREAVDAAAALGVHVLLEKPIADRLAPAQAALTAARSAGIRFAVNYQYRYSRACSRLIAFARSGRLGRVHYLRCNLPWRRGAAYFDESPWHRSRELAGGGTLLTQASHLLDIALCAAAPDSPAGWRAFGVTRQLHFRDVDVEDFAAATIEPGDGPVIQLTSSMAAGVQQSPTIELYAERATVRCTTSPVSRLRIRWGGGRGERSAPEDAGADWAWAPGPHPLARSLEGFRRWVELGVPHRCPAEEAMPVLAVVEAIYRSAESGRAEPVVNWREEVGLDE